MQPQDLFLNVMLSLLGSAYLLYGRKQAAGLQMLCGLLLIVEPYDLPGFVGQLLVGILLAALPFLQR
ncbi:hypothetical protein [Cyanobium sp. FACHB-13342]|uniref:hypothetical protein n=1 Tax=Cyanobium sp. FACHB-13342 TaxID=2692793 RepID=UPI001680369C|nr:hypothetical protein [Cyanobium sp. FACHB-13342]MBD2421933.1 hypothetical protein [Cyanobium sp. FACHB-13342]